MARRGQSGIRRAAHTWHGFRPTSGGAGSGAGQLWCSASCAWGILRPRRGHGLAIALRAWPPEHNRSEAFLRVCMGMTGNRKTQHIEEEERLRDFVAHYAAARGMHHDGWMDAARDRAASHGVSAAFAASTMSTLGARFAAVRCTTDGG